MRASVVVETSQGRASLGPQLKTTLDVHEALVALEADDAQMSTLSRRVNYNSPEGPPCPWALDQVRQLRWWSRSLFGHCHSLCASCDLVHCGVSNSQLVVGTDHCAWGLGSVLSPGEASAALESRSRWR